MTTEHEALRDLKLAKLDDEINEAIARRLEPDERGEFWQRTFGVGITACELHEDWYLMGRLLIKMQTSGLWAEFVDNVKKHLEPDVEFAVDNLLSALSPRFVRDRVAETLKIKQE
jgi:hypothetical protein